ncbi:MAG: hypothetical protein IT580_03850 [Verrucomicrobiales bacterium]|nr:hypothetical protein [Verrucomicrobiales bacterium]
MLKHAALAAGSLLIGAVLLILGAIMPVHLRWVDREVLALSGRGTPSVIDLARRAASESRVGPALWLGAESTAPEDSEFGVLMAQARDRDPSAGRWGGTAPWLDRQLSTVGVGALVDEPTLPWVLPEATRALLLRALTPSSDPTVMALLAARSVSGTRILPAVGSASGQPLDAALLIGATLAETRRVHPDLAREWERAALALKQGRDSVLLEQAMLDLLGLARVMDWEQMAYLVERCEDVASLGVLVSVSGGDEARWRSLFAMVALEGRARPIAQYLARHGETGFGTLRSTLPAGSGAQQALVGTGYPVHEPGGRSRLTTMPAVAPVFDGLLQLVLRARRFALLLKYLFWFDGAFFLIHGLWRLGQAARARRGIARDLARPDLGLQAVFALVLSILCVLGTERLLLTAETTAPPRSSPAKPGAGLTAGRLRFEVPQAKKGTMNEKMLGMLIAFFVIQCALYAMGLGRVRHIRDQPVEDSVKLKLLDNEESMFDAPLYLGIAGSVLALVLRLTGFEGVSLMASYSSTLFGILFCFLLKVVHVRPYRQRLILDSSRENA